MNRDIDRQTPVHRKIPGLAENYYKPARGIAVILSLGAEKLGSTPYRRDAKNFELTSIALLEKREKLATDLSFRLHAREGVAAGTLFIPYPCGRGVYTCSAASIRPAPPTEPK